MVGTVGEMASMKQCNLWKMGGDGLCCSSSAIQTRPGPSSLLEEWSVTPIVFVVFSVLSATSQNWGKRPRYINRQSYTKLNKVPSPQSSASHLLCKVELALTKH